jgi:hypothetical protein
MNRQQFAWIFSLIGVASMLSIFNFALAQQPAQSQTDDARGAFIFTRKNPASSTPTQTAQSTQSPKQSAGVDKNKTAQNGGKPRVKPRQKPVDLAKNKSDVTSAKTEAATSTNAAAQVAPAASPIGIGYTIYQRVEDRMERVDPKKTFYDKDQVRFVIEPNIDGYLYIFVRTDDGEAEMLYPAHRVNGGENKVVAHVPYETPSRSTAIKWFTFDETAGVENVFIVISRQPLPNTPIGKDLVAYCKGIGEECAWKPERGQFSAVLAEVEAPKITSVGKTLGQTQAEIEVEAITRGIKLKAEAPEPVFVLMNVSASKNLLVAKTELTHAAGAAPRPDGAKPEGRDR